MRFHLAWTLRAATRARMEAGVDVWRVAHASKVAVIVDADGNETYVIGNPGEGPNETYITPGGKTIAHGFLTLSLVPRMASTLLEVQKRSTGLALPERR